MRIRERRGGKGEEDREEKGERREREGGQ